MNEIKSNNNAARDAGQIKHIDFTAIQPGGLFYFLDPALPGGSNDLTCFRKTAKGFTNLVTGQFTPCSHGFNVALA